MYCGIAPWERDDGNKEILIPHETVDTDHENGGSAILIANEPRSYREAITAVLWELHTTREVLMAEPEALDLEVDRVAPGVVVCSRVTPLVKEKAFAWVELYPEGGRLAVISIRGRRSTLSKIQLDDLLSIVDRGVDTFSPTR